jgi:predicted choloylglycine hydrolase
VNWEPSLISKLLGTGLTANYKNMLMDSSRYIVTKGVGSGNQVDLSQQVVLNHHPSQTNLGYSYGTLDQEDQLAKQAKEAFTNDYAEMLTNPKKKLLLLGLHPEMNTPNTKTLQTTDLENPFFKEDPASLQ